MTRLHFPARLQAPRGRELWLVASVSAMADAGALGTSLAARGLHRVLLLESDVDPGRIAVAEIAGERSGAPLVRTEPQELGGALEEALAHAGERGSVVLVAPESTAVPLLEELLGVPPRQPSALALATGRATCLRMGAAGWLLAHHNVLDPGSLHWRPEGLGRPS